MDQELNRIKFKRDFRYERKVPVFISCNTGISDELARWVLDRNAILYKDECHAPGLVDAVIAAKTGQPALEHCPVLITTDALIYGTESIIHFYEQRCTAVKRLLPDEAPLRNDVLDLYRLFTGEFFQARIERYFYAQMVAARRSAAVLGKRVPFAERLMLKLRFNSIRKTISNDYGLDEYRVSDHLTEIRKVFQRVSEMLADGRTFLCGDRCTLADLSFAAIGSAMVLPEEFGGVLPAISEIPDDYRQAVIELRATPAGQFLLRLYLENRPSMRPQSEIPEEPGFFGKLFNGLNVSLGKKKYKLFGFLQKRFPVLRIPFTRLVLVTKNDLVTQVLDRDNDFTIEEINAQKMSAQKGAFFLGMDRNNPQFDRERNFVRKASRPGDLELIRSFIRKTADEIIANARPHGKLDLSASFARVIIVRLLDYYFGTPSINEPLMIEWNKVMFYDLFLNFTNNREKHEKAVEYGIQRRDWLVQVIRERKAMLDKGLPLEDNLFNRMIMMSLQDEYKWVDEDVLQRNIGGLLTGIQEGTNKSFILIVDELFNRPEVLNRAIAIARTGTPDEMYGYVSEALRFNPTQPGVIRYSESPQTISRKNGQQYQIKPKSTVMALTVCAMFDPEAFPDPLRFVGDRKSIYMNYGFALHECYGKYINSVTLTEFTAAVLRLNKVRRVPGMAGAGMGLTEGPFPVNYVVAFDEA